MCGTVRKAEIKSPEKYKPKAFTVLLILLLLFHTQYKVRQNKLPHLSLSLWSVVRRLCSLLCLFPFPCTPQLGLHCCKVWLCLAFALTVQGYRPLFFHNIGPVICIEHFLLSTPIVLTLTLRVAQYFCDGLLVLEPQVQARN